MALKPQGFQLGALPHAPAIPSNIGKVDVPGLYDNVVNALKTHEALASSTNRQAATEASNILATQKAASETGLLVPEGEARAALANRATALASPSIVEAEQTLALAEKSNKLRREQFLAGMSPDEEDIRKVHGPTTHLESTTTVSPDGTKVTKQVRKFDKAAGEGTVGGGSSTTTEPAYKPPVFEDTTLTPVPGAPNLFTTKTTTGTAAGKSDLGVKTAPYRGAPVRQLTPATAMTQAQEAVQQAGIVLAAATAGGDPEQIATATDSLAAATAARDEWVKLNAAAKATSSGFLAEQTALTNYQKELATETDPVKRAEIESRIKTLGDYLTKKTQAQGSSKELVNVNALMEFKRQLAEETDPEKIALLNGAIASLEAIVKKQGKSTGLDPAALAAALIASKTKGGATPGTPAAAAPAPAAPVRKLPTPEAIQRLKTNPHEAALFDQTFGVGAAAAALGTR